MPLDFHPEVLKALLSIGDVAVRKHVWEILRSGAFVSRAEHLGDGKWRTRLAVGVDVYFSQPSAGGEEGFRVYHLFIRDTGLLG